MTHIAYFKHCAAPGVNVLLETMLDGIENGTWREPIQQLRACEKGSPAFDKIKKRLPSFMLSASTNGGHKIGDVKEHSGLLQLDIDDVPEHAASLRNRIAEDPHVIAAWLSPSGTGVKGIMRIPADVAMHKTAFETAGDYMRKTYAVEIDPQCKNVNRLCYVSYDSEIMLNVEAVPLEVSNFSEKARVKRQEKNSSPSLNPASASTSCILHNSELFVDFPNLRPLYQKLVAHRYGRPQRGMRNQAMCEIVATCFCSLAPDFVKGFAAEYFHQHSEVFAGYDFETYKREADSVLAGCGRSYPQRLSEGERRAYAALVGEREQAAFRIAQSLSKCESEATVPPPLFFLSCAALGTRLGIMDMSAGRILKGFEKTGIIKTERPGTLRTKGVKGIATVYRWVLTE